MNSEKWKSIVEVVGIAAIVASLVFVGLELRQSQRIAIAAQYQARTDSGREYFYQSLDSQYRLEDSGKVVQNWQWPNGFLSDKEKQWLDEHTPEEWAEAAFWSVINLYGFDNYYFQYQSGLLSEEGWLAMQKRLEEQLFDDPFARYMVVVDGATLRQSFVELSRDLVEEMNANQ